MVIFQILLLSDKRVISKERNTVRASNPRASLTWTDYTSKVGYDANVGQNPFSLKILSGSETLTSFKDRNSVTN